LITTLRKVLPAKWNDNKLIVRFMPLYPLILCSIGVWIPAQQPADRGAGSKVLVGLILGWACGHLNKVWTQTVRGNDQKLRTAETKKQPPKIPASE
jgi:hypothetical protein